MRAPVPFGKYILLDRISVGGMAEVFKAKSFGVEGFEKVIAIKRILPSMGEDPDFIDMFIDEAKIAGQLAHANICQIFELGRIDGAHFIAMEYIWGKDLLQICNRFRKLRQTMPSPMACFAVAKVCEGLDHAHRKRDQLGEKMNIVHRDCSPQNVLISYEGEVKLIDFGIAKAASRSSKTVAGVLKGKFGYMSPEQVRGLALDRRSDIFAAGTVLYECITGERLFQCDSDFSTLEKVRNVSIFPPSHFNATIPNELERIVMKALARNPEDRYQWAGELQRDLQQLLMKQERVFTAKQLGTWLKQAFSVELTRERQLMERYRRVGPDGAPRASTTQSSPPPFAAARPSRASPSPYGGMLGGSARGKMGTGEFDEGPTEVFGELTLDRDADQEILVGRPAAATVPGPAPPAIADPVAGQRPLSEEPTLDAGDRRRPVAARPAANEPTAANVVVGDRAPPPWDSPGSDQLGAPVSPTGDLPSFGSTSAVTPMPNSGVRAQQRRRLLRDVGVGLGIAAAVLAIVAGVKVLVFASDDGAVARNAAPTGTIAVTVPDQKTSTVRLDGATMGSVGSGEALKLANLAPGTYEVRVSRAGVADCVRTISLVEGAIEIASCAFEAASPASAELTLAGALDGAVVFVDGQEISAEATREPLLLSPAAAHEILIKRDGAEDVTFAVNLAPGDRATHQVPEPVPVVDDARQRRRAARKAARALEREARSLTGTAFNATTTLKRGGETAPARPQIEPGSAAAPLPTTVARSDEDGSAAARDASDPGYLIAWTTPLARVRIDGNDTGKTTPIASRSKISLSPGEHTVTFVVGTETFSYPVEIESGAIVKLRKRLPVTAEPR